VAQRHNLDGTPTVGLKFQTKTVKNRHAWTTQRLISDSGPERFIHAKPQPALPTAVWINAPWPRGSSSAVQAVSDLPPERSCARG